MEKKWENLINSIDEEINRCQAIIRLEGYLMPKDD